MRDTANGVQRCKRCHSLPARPNIGRGPPWARTWQKMSRNWSLKLPQTRLQESARMSQARRGNSWPVGLQNSAEGPQRCHSFPLLRFRKDVTDDNGHPTAEWVDQTSTNLRKMSRPKASSRPAHRGPIMQKMSRPPSGSRSPQFGVQISWTEKMSQTQIADPAGELVLKRSETHQTLN
jgi:hypothetical protein